MIKVYASSVIDAPADSVWARIRDFNGLPAWTPFVAESRIEGGQPSDKIGCVRNFRLKDGGMIREQLLTLSDYDYQCSYSILESPMGVDNYVATLKLTPVTDGNRTFAEWWADRARLGDPARLQQPHRLASRGRRIGHRERRALGSGRLRSQFHPEGRQPHPRAASRPLRQRLRLDLLHPRRHVADAALRRHR